MSVPRSFPMILLTILAIASPYILPAAAGARIAAVAAAPVVTAESATTSQLPSEFQNLRVFREDIPREELIDIMRGFSFALGVRCQYCHVGGDGISFAGVEFHSDDDPDKRKARFMLRMVERLNAEILPSIPDRSDPPVRIQCKTCHRGQSSPLLLTDDLRLTLDAEGIDAPVARYRELRENYGMSGAFDFGEWEMNTLGERLADDDRVPEAITVYELNAEFYPESVAINFTLGRLYEEEGEGETAVRYYQRVLDLRPDHQGARERLTALQGSGR